jgi:branched-chain amino acid transport system substrate-binding protein
LTETVELSQLHCAMLVIHEIHAAGGIRRLPIRPVFCDARCETARLGAVAEKMTAESRINNIFGYCMSSGRKHVLPGVKRCNALFVYRAIYDCAVPSNNSAPVVCFLVDGHGAGIAFAGADYIYPHEVNRFMRQVLAEYGVDTPREWQVPIDNHSLASDAVAQRLLSCVADAIFSTGAGQQSIKLYRAFHKAVGQGSDPPIASLMANEAGVATMGSNVMVGRYLRDINAPESLGFLERNRARHGEVSNITNAGKASYSQMNVFVIALAKYGLMDTNALCLLLLGLSSDAPQGRIFIDPDDQQSYLHSRIAWINQDGKFGIEAGIPMAVKPDPYLVNWASRDVRSAAVDTVLG